MFFIDHGLSIVGFNTFSKDSDGLHLQSWLQRGMITSQDYCAKNFPGECILPQRNIQLKQWKQQVDHPRFFISGKSNIPKYPIFNHLPNFELLKRVKRVYKIILMIQSFKSSAEN